MKVICALQARMGSTRLPGKAMKEINGLPILVHIWRRLLACKEVDEVVVAWGGHSDPLFDVAVRHGIRYVTWKEDENLLARIQSAGSVTHADAVLRVRADCLFLDPEFLDAMVRDFRKYWPQREGLINWLPSRCYSEGLDCEIFTMSLLSQLDRDPLCPREDFATYSAKNCYVAPWPLAQNHRYPIGNDAHLSIDTQEDFDRAEKMLKILTNDEWNYAETLKAWEATK